MFFSDVSNMIGVCKGFCSRFKALTHYDIGSEQLSSNNLEASINRNIATISIFLLIKPVFERKK